MAIGKIWCNPFAGNSLHDRRLGIVLTKRITADGPLAAGNFEIQMLAPLDLHTRCFQSGEKATKILADMTEGGVNQPLQPAPDSRWLISSSYVP